MAFTVQEFHDLVALLTQHPEWRADLRRLVLTEELLALPQIVRDLVEVQQRIEQQVAQLATAQQHTEQQVAQLTQQVAQLATAQQHIEQQVAQLATAQQHIEQQVAQLATAQQHTEQQVAQLTQQVAQLTQQVAQLTQQVAQLTQQVAQLTEGQRRTERQIVRLQDDVGELKGIVLEQRYRNRAFAYFSRLLRRMHTVTDDELVILLEEAVARGVLSEDGMHEIARADVVVQGQRRESPGEVYLVVEVSWGVGPGDVERAVRRAALLGQTGLQTMPVVAGERITDEAAELARAMRVWQVLDGRVAAPPPNGHSLPPSASS